MDYTKTQVYFLEAGSYNAVVFRQDDVALVFDSAPSGLFDSEVDLYQTNDDDRCDTDRITAALANYIGDGSNISYFSDLVNDSLSGSTSITALPWSIIENNDGCSLTNVTEYDDVKLDEEMRAQIQGVGERDNDLSYNISQDNEQADSEIIIDGSSKYRGR